MGTDLPFIVGLADDEICYVLPPEELELPENPFDPSAHYEETMSLGKDAATRLLAAWNEQLQEE